MRCPCGGCRERRAGTREVPPCHAGCGKYRAWKDEWNDGKRKIEPNGYLVPVSTKRSKKDRIYMRIGGKSE